jgi:hypothetical protein
LNEGLTLIVKDYDAVGRNETLGMAVIPSRQLYLAKGERMEFKLQTPPGTKENNITGWIAVRCRRATENDKSFMEGYHSSMKAATAPAHPVTKNSNIRSILTRREKVSKEGIKKVS